MNELKITEMDGYKEKYAKTVKKIQKLKYQHPRLSLKKFLKKF